MRKKICVYCNNIVEDTHRCIKKPKREKTERTKESDKLINNKRWKDKRLHILKRDKYMCMRCWHKYKIINTENLQVHHIKSRIDFPHLCFEDSNLLVVCKYCNLSLESNHLNHELDFDWTPPEKEYNL